MKKHEPGGESQARAEGIRLSLAEGADRRGASAIVAALRVAVEATRSRDRRQHSADLVDGGGSRRVWILMGLAVLLWPRVRIGELDRVFGTDAVIDGLWAAPGVAAETTRGVQVVMEGIAASHRGRRIGFSVRVGELVHVIAIWDRQGNRRNNGEGAR